MTIQNKRCILITIRQERQPAGSKIMKTLPLEKQIELAKKMKKNFSNSKNENLKKIIDKILIEKLQELNK